MKKTLFILLLVLLTPTLVLAQEQASLEELRNAAGKGNAEAQLEIGILYEFGYNMPKNEVAALAWYLYAADQGNQIAVKRREQLKSRMKPAEVDEAQKLARELSAPKPPKPEKTETPPPPASPSTSVPSDIKPPVAP